MHSFGGGLYGRLRGAARDGGSSPAAARAAAPAAGDVEAGGCGAGAAPGAPHQQEEAPSVSLAVLPITRVARPLLAAW